MSATASFIILDKDKIETITSASKIITRRKLFKKEITDNYYQTLEPISEFVDQFEGNGYIYGTIIVYIDQEKGIDITSGELDQYSDTITKNRGASTIFFTQKQKEQFNQLVKSLDFEGDKFKNFCFEFSGNEEEFKYAKEAVDTLSNSLNKITDDSKALLLEIG